MSTNTGKRTKSQIRASKSFGAQFEYSVLDSIKQKYLDAFLTKQLGFPLQYDIEVPPTPVSRGFAIECKCRKDMTWIKAKSYFEKLERLAH